MNRLVCTNMDRIDVAALPPAQRDVGGPARVLFLHGLEFGFGSTTRHLIGAAEGRSDIDAVHCKLRLPRALALARKQAPRTFFGRWDFQGWRTIHAWRRVIMGLLAPPRPVFPLDRFDVVHIMAVQRALAVEHLAARARPTRFMVNIDATTIAYDAAFNLRTAAPRPEIALERRTMLAADAVACASRWAMESAHRDYGVPLERLFLHMPCAPVPAEHRRARTLDPSRPLRIIFVGNDWARKGGPRLLRWHQQRWSRRAELHICSAGAPRDAGAANVTWHGATPHDRLMSEVLPAMDLFVMPTREDTFLIAAQEAQACGIPVVTSRLAAIPEVVADDISGILCDHADDDAFLRAVERLMDEPGLLERLSRGALARTDSEVSAPLWHNHLMDQIVALAGGRPLRTLPARLEPTATAPAATQPAPGEPA